jgi:hypothetical protein
MLAGAYAPTALRFRDEPASARHWEYAQNFLNFNRPSYSKYFVLGRLGMIPISCFAAWVVYRWARALYGGAAAVVSCALYCFDPNILAHASLVTTDAGTSAAILTSAWLWWRFCRRPLAGRLLLASLAIAAALLCKFSSLLLLPALLFSGILFVLSRRLNWRTLLGGLSVVAIVSLLLINLAYLYHRTFMPLSYYEFASATMQRVSSRLPSWLPVPLPRFFVEGFDAQKWEAEARLPSFALGEFYAGSRWYYYPLALGCKLPVGTLLLLAVALLTFWKHRLNLHECLPLIFAIIFLLGIIFLSDLNIGIRYALPALPLLYVLAGRAWATLRGRMRTVIVLMLLLSAGESLRFAPNFLSFFNLAAGGAERGQFVLNDSNFDWGQGLISLRDWMKDNQVDRITMACFERVDPAIYGIDSVPLSRRSIDTEYVAVSSYFLAGLPQRLRDGEQFTPYLQLRDPAAWRAIQPVAVVDRIIRIYRREDLAGLMRSGPLMVPPRPPGAAQKAS